MMSCSSSAPHGCRTMTNERGLAGRRPTSDKDIASFFDGAAQHPGLIGRHDAGGDVIVEGEDRDGRLADGESGCCDDGRKQSFESLTAFRQLRENAWSCRMHLRTNMMRDEPDDAFAIDSREPFTRIDQPFPQTIDP